MTREASIRTWLVAFEGSELLDISGPWEVLSHANEVLGRPAYDLRMMTPGDRSLRTRHGVVLAKLAPLPTRPRALPHLLFVAGGMPVHPAPEPERKGAAWLRKHHRQIPTIASICTGAFVLGHAGLLDGRRATTHWAHTAQLGKLFPRCKVTDEGIFVQDGRIWTSAGITAGIDLALSLVERDHGHRVAIAVAKKLVLFLRRSGQQAQFSAVLRQQERDPERDVVGAIMGELDRPLSVDALGKRVGMSTRSLSRYCRARFDASPAQLVRRIRVERAQRLLEESDLPLKVVATRVGLGDAATLWRAFTTQLGITPAAYRQRFHRG